MGDIRQLARDLAASEPAHLDFEQVASYAEGSADAIDRELVESHIAHCARCRREVRDLAEFARPRSRRVWLAVAAALAIAILGGFFATRERKPQTLVIPREAILLHQSELALRGATHGQTLEPLSPIGRIVVDDRPRFDWTAIPNARYRVEIFDERFRPIASSALVSEPRWTPNAALPRGGTFLWQVTAFVDAKEITAPAPPAPEARFHVLEASRAEQLAQLERNESRPSLALGVAYAEAGALDEAERELQAVVASKRDGRNAARFLRIVQAHTR